MPVVVDASVIVELLTRSRLARQVRQAIGNERAVAPELLDVEVGAALAKLERTYVLSAERGRAALGLLARSGITRVSHRLLIADAWERRKNLSLYDAMYVALAARLGCPLLTADRRLASAPNLGIAVTVLA